MGIVAAVGTAVTAVASSVGIAVTATALTVGFETIAAVGAVLGVVGKVAKIPALSMAGLALGAVGGLGALASGPGLLRDGAGINLSAGAGTDGASAGIVDSVASDASTGVAAGEGFAPEAATSGIGGAAGSGVVDQGAFDAGTGAAGSVNAATGDVATGATASASSGPDPGLFLGATKSVASAALPDGQSTADLNDASLRAAQQGGSLLPDGSSGGLINQTAPPAPTVPPPISATPGATSAAPGTTAAPSESFGAGTSDTTPGAGTSGGSSMQGLLDFANKNPVVAFGALQAGGSLLTGAFSTLTPAQVGAYNAQAAANDAAAAFTAMQTKNLQSPKAVASTAPVTGAPQTLVPPPSVPVQPQAAPLGQGFINQAPAPTARSLVTGAPHHAAAYREAAVCLRAPCVGPDHFA